MERRVVVVGAGLAGLSCARRLADAGVAVVIVESESIGGRVQQSSHNGESYELGAEFLHGGAASAKALADACGARTSRVFTAAHGDGGPDDEPAPDGGVALYHVEGRTLPHDSDDAGFETLNAALGALPERINDSRSLAAYLRDAGVPPRMLRLAAASYSNTLGVGSAGVTLSGMTVSSCNRIVSVAKGSRADKAGLRAFDLIQTVDGAELRGKFEDQIAAHLRSSSAAEKSLSLGVERPPPADHAKIQADESGKLAHAPEAAPGLDPMEC